MAAALQALDSRITADVLAETLPLIGTGLQDARTAEDAALTAIDALRKTLLAGLTDLQDVTSHSVGEIENALNDALGAAGFATTLSVTETLDGFTVGYDLSRSNTTQIALASDMGLPGLALSIAGSTDVALDLDAALAFGLDASGFYLDTSANEIGLTVSITNAALDANTTTPFGALNFSATDAGSGLSGAIDIEITDPDGRLRAGETVSLSAASAMTCWRDAVAATLSSAGRAPIRRRMRTPPAPLRSTLPP